jgi:hypothetical protein
VLTLTQSLDYVVQGHRYDIFEDVGCTPVVVATVASILLIYIWPIVIGLISAVYCSKSLIIKCWNCTKHHIVLSLRALFQRQAQFSQFLATNKAITISRYIRLMALATTEILFTTPLATFALALNLIVGISPYLSWEDIHYDFGRVGQFAGVYWKANRTTVISLQLTRYSGIFCALVFFGFFGFAEEARRHYWAAGRWVIRPFTPLFTRISRLVSQPHCVQHLLIFFHSYIFPQHKSLLSTSTTSVSVEVKTSTCRFDYNKDLEKGLSASKSLDGCDEVPFTPSSEPLPLYESHPSYARAL